MSDRTEVWDSPSLQLHHLLWPRFGNFGSKEKNINKTTMVHCLIYIYIYIFLLRLKIKVIYNDLWKLPWSAKNWTDGLVLSHTDSLIQQKNKFLFLWGQNWDLNMYYKFLKLAALDSFDFPFLLLLENHHSLEDTLMNSSPFLSICKKHEMPFLSLGHHFDLPDIRCSFCSILFWKPMIEELWLTFEH